MATLPPLSEDVDLGEEIGRGGFGLVRRGVFRSTGQPVAVKVALESTPVDLESEDRILREVSLISAVRHPRLARFLGMYRDSDGRLALVYEFVPGVPLSEAVLGPVAPDQIRAWIEDIAAALDALHQEKILHRDLKPANVMVEPDGRATLLDFGIARLEDKGGTLTRTGLIVGTPEFMGPEGFLKQRVERTYDVYALACLAYWLLEAVVPHPGENVAEMLTEKQRGSPLRITRLTGAAAAACQRLLVEALAPDPTARPPSAGVFAARLRDALAAKPDEQAETLVLSAPAHGLAPSVIPETDPARTATSRRRLGGAGAAVALLLGGLGWGFFGDGGRGKTDSRPPPATVLAPTPVAPRPFPERYGEELRMELEDAKLWRRQADGKVLRDPDQASLTKTTEFLSPDPDLWWETLALLEKARAVVTWRSGGGDPSELNEVLRQELADVGERYVGEGLPNPFTALLDRRPAAAMNFPGYAWNRLRRQRHDPDLLQEVEGWFASFLVALADLWKAYHRDLKIYRAGQIPIKLPVIHSVSPTFFTLDSFADQAAQADGPRAHLATWLRPGREALATMLVSAAWSVREEPETKVLVALLVDHILGHGMNLYFYTDLAFFPVDEFYPPGPSGPWAFLRGRLLQAQFFAQKHRKRTLEGGHRARAELLKALGHPGSHRYDRELRSRALVNIVKLDRSLKQPSLLGVRLRDHADVIDAMHPRLRAGLYAQALAALRKEFEKGRKGSLSDLGLSKDQAFVVLLWLRRYVEVLPEQRSDLIGSSVDLEQLIRTLGKVD